MRARSPSEMAAFRLFCSSRLFSVWNWAISASDSDVFANRDGPAPPGRRCRLRASVAAAGVVEVEEGAEDAEGAADDAEPDRRAILLSNGARLAIPASDGGGVLRFRLFFFGFFFDPLLVVFAAAAAAAAVSFPVHGSTASGMIKHAALILLLLRGLFAPKKCERSILVQ